MYLHTGQVITKVIISALNEKDEYNQIQGWGTKNSDNPGKVLLAESLKQFNELKVTQGQVDGWIRLVLAGKVMSFNARTSRNKTVKSQVVAKYGELKTVDISTLTATIKFMQVCVVQIHKLNK